MMLFFLLLAISNAENFKLVVAHSNDVHARIEQCQNTGATQNCNMTTPWDTSKHSKYFKGCHGGAARRMTKLKDIRAENQNVILLSGGDDFQGTMWFTHFQGLASAQVLKELKYDAFAFGNHEFDSGTETLAKFIDASGSDVKFLSANMQAAASNPIHGKYTKSHVFEYGDHKVGVIGYITKDTSFLTLGALPGSGLTFEDEIRALNAEAAVLKAEGVEIIIALGHAGFSKDKEIAKSVHGIDVVVGGHTDTFLYTGNPADQSKYAYPGKDKVVGDYPTIETGINGQKVCVVQAFTVGTWLGKLTVTFNEAGSVESCTGNPIFLSGETITQDPYMVGELKMQSEQIHALSESPVGNLAAPTFGKPEVRFQESGIANVINDAYLWQLNKQQDGKSLWGSTRLSFINGGGIRENLNVGTQTFGTIKGLMPFSNLITVARNMPGQKILEALEHGVTSYGGEGRFGHWGGIRYEFNPALPEGKRIVKALIRCTNCTNELGFDNLFDKLEETYDVIVNSYTVSGGDGYTQFKAYDENIGGVFTDFEPVVAYFKALGNVIPKLDGRIKKVSTARESSSKTPCTAAGKAGEKTGVSQYTLFSLIFVLALSLL